MVFNHTYRIGLEDCGKENEATNKAILTILEDIAGLHSATVGLGLNEINKTGCAWVILKWQVQIIKRPEYNDELNVFDIALKDALDLLNLNGRISVITFHSLEDKICKYTFNEVSKLKDVPKGLPIIPLEMQPKFKLVNRKPIIASDDELTHNHRAHSAKLRVIERVIL